MSTGVVIALATSGCILVWTTVLACWLGWQKRASRGTSTTTLLAALQHDAGARALARQAARSDTWWQDAEPDDVAVIDHTLSLWNLLAQQATEDRGTRRAMLRAAGWRVVELWEQAYPYIQHQRHRHPTLAECFEEMYVDAHRATRAAAAEPGPAVPSPVPSPSQIWITGSEPRSRLSVSPGPDKPAPPAADGAAESVVAAEPVVVSAAQVDEDVWLASLKTALRSIESVSIPAGSARVAAASRRGARPGVVEAGPAAARVGAAVGWPGPPHSGTSPPRGVIDLVDVDITAF